MWPETALARCSGARQRGRYWLAIVTRLRRVFASSELAGLRMRHHRASAALVSPIQLSARSWALGGRLPVTLRHVPIWRRQSAWHASNERLNPVAGLPAPLRILCRLTRGNRQPRHPVGDRRVATARLAGQKLTGGAARPRHCACPSSRGCRAYTRCMSATREELHHLVDQLPAAALLQSLKRQSETLNGLTRFRRARRARPVDMGLSVA
jgi:hypothetical protein